MKRLAFGLLALVAILALVAGSALADTQSLNGKRFADGRDALFVSDLGEGTPTVQLFDSMGNDITASNAQILASGNDFIRIQYQSTDATYLGQSSADMLEPDMTLSDRILITADGSSRLDVQFQSDPGITLGQVNPFPSQLETGGFQNMYPGLPDSFNFLSDVPEPAAMPVLGLCFAGLAAYGWRRRKPKSA